VRKVQATVKSSGLAGLADGRAPMTLRRAGRGDKMPAHTASAGAAPPGLTETEVPGEIDEALSGFGAEPGGLIPALQAVQESVGYLPPEAIQRVARHFNVPESTVYGIATFYAQFYLTPQGRHRIKVCCGTACHVRGSGGIMSTVCRKLGIEPGGTTGDLKFSVERVACFGSCALAPVVVADDEVHGRMTPEATLNLIKNLK
jgi:NADH-quinone oxidoreductase subunit E